MATPVHKRKQNIWSPKHVGAPDWSFREKCRLHLLRWLYRRGRLNDG